MHALAHIAPILAADSKSKTPFYIAGGALVAWALVVSLGLGLRDSRFPRTIALQRLVTAITAVLVVAAASMAVVTSGGSTRASETGSAGGPSKPLAPGSAGGTVTASKPPTSRPAQSSSSSRAAAPAGAPGGAVSDSADPSGQLRFTASRLAAKAGRVSIAFTNGSPLAHNLTLVKGNRVLGKTPTFQSGTHRFTVTLAPGTYKFFCSVPGHREAGMEGTLTVS